MALAKVSCLVDSPAGFKKGSTYSIVSFGETAALLWNDNSKITGVSHSSLNDDAQWKVEPVDSDAPKKAKPSNPAPVDPVPTPISG